MVRALSPRLAIWIGLLALLIAINALITFSSVRTLRANELRLLRSLETINALGQMLSTLQDAETGQRGYLITGDAAYLAPYLSARGHVDEQMSRLDGLLAGAGSQSPGLGELKRSVADKLAELQQTIDLRAEQGFAAAQQVVLAGRGKQEMDAARATIAAMQADEERDFGLRTAESLASAQLITIMQVLAAAISLACVGVVGYRTQRDLAARAAAAEELRVQREWFATALTSIGDAVLTTDVQGRVTFMNPMAETLTGWPADQARGQDHRAVFQIVNETTRAPVESPVLKAIREGTVVGLANHTLLISRGGVEIPIDDSGAPISDLSGRVIGVVLVFRNIRERKRAEDAQQLLIDASAALADGLGVETRLTAIAQLIVPRYADLCIVFLRADDGLIYRVASASVDPAADAQLRALHPHPIAPDDDHVAAQVMRSGRPLLNPPIPAQSVEAVAASDVDRRRLRALVPPSQIIMPLLARGQTLGAVALGRIDLGWAYEQVDLPVAQELGYRIAIALQNAQLYEAAQAAVRMRDRFLSIAAHELKTPLTAILGQIQLIQRRSERSGALNERDQRSFATVAGQASRLNRMIAALFDISRLEHGQLSITRAPLELTAFVGQVIDELQPTLGERQVLYAAPAEPLLVSGDMVRLEQVLQNLITNAVKYDTTSAPVQVRLERRGDLACVAVSDRGIGIPQAALPHIFQRFYRAPNADDQGIGGFGIGLAIVREIVALHGGTIDVESVEGQGSTFTVALPLAVAAE